MQLCIFTGGQIQSIHFCRGDILTINLINLIDHATLDQVQSTTELPDKQCAAVT